MKFNFFKEAPVMPDENELKRIKLVNNLKSYGTYLTGGGNYGTYSLDNERRDKLFAEIIAGSHNLSDEDFNKACHEANMIDTEIEDLNSVLREYKNKTAKQPEENL